MKRFTLVFIFMFSCTGYGDSQYDVNQHHEERCVDNTKKANCVVSIVDHSTNIDQDLPVEPSFFEPTVEIDVEEMLKTIETLASKKHGGRAPGSAGIALSRAHILFRLKEYKLLPENFNILVGGLPIKGVNLVLKFEGKGKLKDETVVALAHYDHLGLTESGKYYAGAQDNAGGVAALIEIVLNWKKYVVRSQRNLIFIFSDGEEKGLLGAKEWVAKHAADESIVSAISVDGFGGFMGPSHSSGFALGTDSSSELHDAVMTINEGDNFRVLPFPFYVLEGRSDHAVFHAKSIPVIHFASGIDTEIYHQVADTAEKIKPELLKKGTRWLTYLIRNLSTLEDLKWEPDTRRNCSEHARSFQILLDAYDKDSDDSAQKGQIDTIRKLLKPFAGKELEADDKEKCDNLLRFIYSQIEDQLSPQ